MNGVNLLVQLLEDGGESADHVEISLHSQPPEADFAAPSSDDVDELGRSRGSQMTSLPRIIGHGRRERGGGRWKQHGAPLDAFSRLACQSEIELASLHKVSLLSISIRKTRDFHDLTYRGASSCQISPRSPSTICHHASPPPGAAARSSPRT